MRKPTYTMESLPATWKDIMISGMSEGKGPHELFKDLGIGDDVHARFLRDYPEYAETYRKGYLEYRAWWERTGRENLHNRNFNNTMWIFNMKNRFSWRDQPVIEIKSIGAGFKDQTEREVILAEYSVSEDKQGKQKELN